MHRLYTTRRDKLKALDKRFDACALQKRPEHWLFPDFGILDHWKEEAPDGLSARDKVKWANKHRSLKLNEHIDAIDTRLTPAAKLEARFYDGELQFFINGVPVINEVFVNEKDGQQILRYWQHLARTILITEKFKAKTLMEKLGTTPMTENADLSAQIEKLTREIEALDNEIATAEAELNEIIYGLYGLTEEERRIIQ